MADKYEMYNKLTNQMHLLLSIHKMMDKFRLWVASGVANISWGICLYSRPAPE
jgi:hypothetical protein